MVHVAWASWISRAEHNASHRCCQCSRRTRTGPVPGEPPPRQPCRGSHARVRTHGPEQGPAACSPQETQGPTVSVGPRTWWWASRGCCSISFYRHSLFLVYFQLQSYAKLCISMTQVPVGSPCLTLFGTCCWIKLFEIGIYIYTLVFTPWQSNGGQSVACLWKSNWVVSSLSPLLGWKISSFKTR